MSKGGAMATTDEVARELGLTRETVQQAIRHGKLRARKVGRMWFVDRRAIEAYKAEHLNRKGWAVRREREGRQG
jgi:excisionase family DNA binding protein